jgi:hypothetical protein
VAQKLRESQTRQRLQTVEMKVLRPCVWVQTARVQMAFSATQFKPRTSTQLVRKDLISDLNTVETRQAWEHDMFFK